MKLHNYDTFSKPVFFLSIANPFTSNALPEWNALDAVSLEFIQVNSILLVFSRNHRELSWWIINCWCELAILFIHNLKDILFRFKTRFAMWWQWRRRRLWRQQRHDANCCASLPFEMIALNGNFRWCENGKMRKFKFTKNCILHQMKMRFNYLWQGWHECDKQQWRMVLNLWFLRNHFEMIYFPLKYAPFVGFSGAIICRRNIHQKLIIPSRLCALTIHFGES